DRRYPHQTRDDVRSAGVRIPARISGCRDGVGGEAADGDVIRVDVEAVRIERGDDRRPRAPYQRHERLPDRVWRRVRQLAITVVEQVQLVEADDSDRLPELRLPPGGE